MVELLAKQIANGLEGRQCSLIEVVIGIYMQRRRSTVLIARLAVLCAKIRYKIFSNKILGCYLYTNLLVFT
jgi:hypothetical protein